MPKRSVVVFKGSEPSDRALWRCNDQGIYHGKESAPKKKYSRVSPCFDIRNFLK
jgi:hypothetical protein